MAMVNLYAIISIYGLTAVSGANLFVLEASAINLMRNNVSLMPFFIFVTVLNVAIIWIMLKKSTVYKKKLLELSYGYSSSQFLISTLNDLCCDERIINCKSEFSLGAEQVISILIVFTFC